MKMDRHLRQVVGYGVLATIGLALAAWVWQTEDAQEVRTGSVAFADCSESNLKAVALEVGVRRVAISFMDERASVSLTRRVAVTIPGKATETQTLVMAASQSARRLRTRYAPAMASRNLGKVTAARLKTLGLTDSKEALVITCGPKVSRFSVGTTSYGGAGRYVQNQGDKQTWLVDPTLISDVRLADSRFVERRIVATAQRKLAEAKISAQGREVTLVQRNRTSQGQWVNKATPNRRDELYGNWIAKLLRLRAVTWLAGKPGEDGAPATDIRTVVSVKFDGRAPIVLSRGVGASGKPAFWAKSPASGGWVTVSASLAGQLAADVGAVVEK
ncbi:MAG: hypothetical protein KC502_06990 [Myxococcales bacterium]|nr:hypothetical protein [Myxococcales bacterium]